MKNILSIMLFAGLLIGCKEKSKNQDTENASSHPILNPPLTLVKKTNGPSFLTGLPLMAGMFIQERKCLMHGNWKMGL